LKGDAGWIDCPGRHPADAHTDVANEDQLLRQEREEDKVYEFEVRAKNPPEKSV
jgi:hypothetical protein